MSRQEELAAALLRQEEARRSSLRERKTGLGVIAALAVPGALWLYAVGNTGGAVTVALLSVGVAMWYMVRLDGRGKEAFKDAIVPILLEGIDPTLRFDSGACVTQGEFEAADMYVCPDSYAGSDLVTGRVGDTAIRFSLVHAQERYEETSTDSDGKSDTTTRYRTIFNGLFFIADFNKNFHGSTLLKPEAVGLFGRMAGSRVALEDPGFSKLFTVNSTDQVEARYILTPALMERLKTLRSRVGPFNASFTGGNLYMALQMDSDAFEPEMNRPLADKSQADRILSNLRSVTDIVDDLGLNVRVWTKTDDAREETGPASEKHSPSARKTGVRSGKRANAVAIWAAVLLAFIFALPALFPRVAEPPSPPAPPQVAADPPRRVDAPVRKEPKVPPAVAVAPPRPALAATQVSAAAKPKREEVATPEAPVDALSLEQFRVLKGRL